MSRIEIVLHLQLPTGEELGNTCKAQLHNILEAHAGIEQIMLVDDGGEGTANLSFCFEGEQNLDKIVDDIVEIGATILQQFIQLPSALTGIADEYDVRDAGTSISKALSSIEGVINASVSNRGIARMECAATSLNIVLHFAIKLLTAFRNESSNE